MQAEQSVLLCEREAGVLTVEGWPRKQGALAAKTYQAGRRAVSWGHHGVLFMWPPEAAHERGFTRVLQLPHERSIAPASGAGFSGQPAGLLRSDPSLTKLARCPAEIGRIEFKTCDRCADFSLYVALLALLKGLALDDTLKAQATVPDRSLHQRAARFGFAQDDLFVGSQTVLNASAKALNGDPDVCFLESLYYLPQIRITPAHRLAQSFHATTSIERLLRATYQEIPVPIGGNAWLV